MSEPQRDVQQLIERWRKLARFADRDEAAVLRDCARELEETLRDRGANHADADAEKPGA